MDIQMPEMDGFATTRWLREWEAREGRPRLPVIALTANVLTTNLEQCLEAGMDAFLSKPVMLPALGEALGRWLATTVPTAREIDRARLAGLVVEIEALLAEDDFDVFGRFRALQDLLAGTPLASQFDEVGRLIEQLRFDAALASLRRARVRAGGIAA